MASPVRRAMLLLILVCLVSAGCASSGDRDSGATRSGLLIDAAEAADLGYRINWVQNLDVSRGQRIVAAEILDDLLVTVERPTNLVTAVSLRDGSVAWRRVIGTTAERLQAPTRVEDTILINSGTRLYSLRVRDGAIREARELSPVATTSPLALNGLVYLGSVNGIVYGMNRSNGVVQWSYGLGGRITAPLAAAGGSIVAADTSGNYVLLDARTGRMRWRERTFAEIAAKPVFDEDRVFIASRDGSLYAVDRATGMDAWVYHGSEPLTVSPAVYDGVVVLPVPGRSVVALAADGSGEPLWQVSEGEARPVTSRDGAVLLAGGQKLMLVDLQNGTIRGTAPTQTLQAVLEGPDNSLIALSPQGRIMRLNLAQQ